MRSAAGLPVTEKSSFGAENVPGVTGNVTLKPLDQANAAPTVGTTVHHWRCGLPADGTTIAAKYLPGSCRGEN